VNKKRLKWWNEYVLFKSSLVTRSHSVRELLGAYNIGTSGSSKSAYGGGLLAALDDAFENGEFDEEEEEEGENSGNGEQSGNGGNSEAGGDE
jgi:hypothetical protein